MSSYLIPAHTPAERVALDLNWLLTRLRSHVKLILACAVLCAGAGWLISKLQPAYYSAQGEILVQGGSFAIPQLQGAVRNDAGGGDPMIFVRSETEAVQSRAVIQQVIDQLGLARTAEFNPMLRTPSLQSEIIGGLKSLLPGGHSSAADEQGMARAESDAVMGTVTKNLKVFNDGRSLVISIGFTAQDPQVASSFVNTLIRDYTQGQVTGRNTLNKGANASLIQQTADVHARIDDLAARITALRQKNELVELPGGSATQQQLTELATAAARASTDRAQAESLWARATELSRRGDADQLAAVVGSNTISQMRGQESQSASKLAVLTARYGANYPDVQAARADLAATQRQIAGEEQRIIGSLSAAARTARQQEAEATRQMDKVRRASVRTANQEAELTQLQEEITSQRTLYGTLLSSEQQTMAQSTPAGTPDIRVISEATPPGFPAGPNTHMAGLLGGLAGTVLGCCLALTLQRRESAFSNAAMAVANTNMPVLAVLGGQGDGQSGTLATRVVANPSGSEADALRAMRTRLRMAGATTGSVFSRSVMFTSCSREENAPGVAAAFARLAAMDGEKVLLIEGNLRAPAMQLLLQAPSANFVSVLESRQSWRGAVTRDGTTSLDLLLAAQHAPTSHALLNSEYLKTLLIEAQADYSWVVLDAPPAAISADAMSLARSVDATVVVVDDTHTSLESLREGVGRLNAVAQNLAGLALLQKAA